MSLLDVLFVFPKFANGRSFEGFDYHLGAGFIRGTLERRGYRTEQFVHPGDQTLGGMAELILERGAKVVGFSVYDINYYFVKLLAEEMRRRDPSVVIITGGPTATFSPEIILGDCLAIDLCVRSYGETAAIELMEWVNGTKQLESIPGVTYRDKGIITETRGRTLEEALKIESDCNGEDAPGLIQLVAKKPSKTLDALDVFPDPYLNGYIPISRISDIGIVTSRGCTFPCTFCNFSAMSDRKISFHSIPRVIELLRYVEEEVANSRVKKDDGDRKLVAINDDNFSLNPRRFHELLEHMAAENFQNIEFWAEMRTETLKDESFPLLKRASFGEINYGLESGVPHVLAAIKKVRSSGWEKDDFKAEKRFLDLIRWGVKKGQEAGISTSVSVILGSPGETSEDGNATLEYVESLGVNRYAHNFISVLAGTELAATYESFGLRREPSPGKALPYWTYPTYDVYSLPIHEHDQIWLPERGIEMLHVFSIFSGSTETDLGPALEHRLKGRTEVSAHLRAGSDDSVVPIIVLAYPALRETVFSWLVDEMPMAASIWIEHDGRITRGEIQEKLAHARVPVQEVNTLRTVESPGATTKQVRINELSLSAPATNTRTLYSLPLADVDFVSLPEAVSAPRTTLLLTTDTLEDVERLEEILTAGTPSGIWSIPSQVLRARTSLEDGCRWCGKACPATTGAKLIVTEIGEIKPCRSGRAIGHVGDTLSQIREQAQELMVAERERRGCNECPVQDSCSKCLFPAPIDSDRYCEIRLRHPDLGAVMDGMVLARSLTHAGLLPRALFNTLTEGGMLPPSDSDCEISSLGQVESTLRVNDELVPLSQFVMLSFSSDSGGFLYYPGKEIAH